MPIFYDRVKETTTTTGTGTITLAGAATGYRAFSSVLSNSQVTYYAIVGSTTEWEVGSGAFTTAGTTLARTTILASSNAGAAVNFSAGTKDVFIPIPAATVNEIALRKNISSTAHGFAVGDVLYLNGSTYTKAQADTAAKAEVVGIVSEVPDANTFVMTSGGRVTGLSGLTAGTVYFLSPSSAGALTSTEPSTAGQIVKPLLIADSTTSGYFFNMRGSVVADTALEQARDNNGVYVLGQSGASTASTNTTSEETLVTVTVPANAMGSNGMLVIMASWSCTNNANSKTARIRFNGIGGTSYQDLSLTSTLSNSSIVTIINRNATNSQVGLMSATRPERFGTASANAQVTSSVSTTSAVDIVFTSQKATGTDSLALEWYQVLLYPK